MVKRIFVIDRTEFPPVATGEWQRVEKTPSHSGLASLARTHCANFGLVCKNCRLCVHRHIRCGYFERAVLPGLSIKQAERYASGLDVALENLGRQNRKVASWDRLEIPDAT